MSAWRWPPKGPPEHQICRPGGRWNASPPFTAGGEAGSAGGACRGRLRAAGVVCGAPASEDSWLLGHRARRGLPGGCRAERVRGASARSTAGPPDRAASRVGADHDPDDEDRVSRRRQSTRRSGFSSCSSLCGMDEPVRLTTVDDEQEAEIVCGLLRSTGIECGHRVTQETDSMLRGIQPGGGTRSSFTGPTSKPPRPSSQTRTADRYRTSRCGRPVGGGR